ncbi:MAG: hypothetical protein ACTHKC_04125 [Candidatus Nitrosocosmicus sp.]
MGKDALIIIIKCISYPPKIGLHINVPDGSLGRNHVAAKSLIEDSTYLKCIVFIIEIHGQDALRKTLVLHDQFNRSVYDTTNSLVIFIIKLS